VRVRILQHVPFEGPAALQPALRAGGHELAVTRLCDGDPLPDADSLDWLVVLGGPMSAHDVAEHAWLAPEKRLVRDCVERGRRVLGVCLGAQLVAESLGARVVRNPEREIGWFPVERVPGAEASPLGRALPARFPAFHWHGETFDLPPGALHLARSKACEQQAFSFGEHVLALQFHLETTRAAAEALVAHCRDELAPGPFVQPPDAILADAAPFDAMRPLLDAVLGALAGRAPHR
jgi:GMP synthase-like glutamine amidotransferase